MGGKGWGGERERERERECFCKEMFDDEKNSV